MLKKNLDSKPVPEDRKRPDHFWKEVRCALFSSLILVLTLPVALMAQITASTPQGNPQAAVYGSGFQAPLLFQGEQVPTNQVSFGLSVSALYDDNVFGRNSQRVGDEALTLSPSLGITKQSPRLVASFDYVPFFLLYRQITGLDHVNHAATLNLVYRLSSHFNLGLHDTFSYQDGNYPALNQQTIMSGPPSPTALSNQILVYTTRTLSNSAGLDLTFAKSKRTSVTFSGGYNLVKYGGQTAAQPLYNANGFSGSMTFRYLLNEHSSLGMLLLHQDTTYQGGEFFGYRVRSQIESAFLSFAFRPSPSVSFTIFGGPQYVGTIGQGSAESTVPAHLQGSGGGSLTKEVRDTALDFAVQRSVSGSGGLYTSVIYTTAIFAVRRRLVRRWEIDCHGGAAEQDASLFRLANGKTEGLFGGVIISRPLAHGSVFHVTYDSWHQVSKGNLPVISNFDTNQIAVGIDYRFKTLAIGR